MVSHFPQSMWLLAFSAAFAPWARPLDALAGPKWFCEAGSNVRACVEKGLSPRTSAALGSFVGPTLL